ncbi:HsdM family class I SAM-dependent methyltransferase [Bacillus cereus]|uniref:HsdM family class I SAM-dependent methyltransferase n=1 Tax=Bacillus cereus TaxID=1396 RepID=UPI0011A5382E|nr:N-6 DNA methylase [Bacillus cereus]MCU5640850.1 SAM-dependent methyltransferase [Bacillus cereus]
MGKVTRTRWTANVKAMEIVSKPKTEIVEEDITFLKENYTSMGGLLPKGFNGGAFFTPTHVAKFLWDALRSKLPETPRILEPSAGSGVFLEHAPEDAEITAIELDETSAKVTSIIYPKADVIRGNALDHDLEDYYDLVIGNPPYGEKAETKREYRTLTIRKGTYTGKTENAFIELAIRAAKPGGYVALVLPMGVSFSQQSIKIRKFMHENCWQVATIHLPGETFQHVGTTISTQIIILRKVTPNAKLIEPVTKKWGSNFKRSDYKDINEYGATFYEGQTPAYFAVVTDIGWDKKGNKTDKWGDGLTQLDELVDDFTDDNLTRENLYPHIPSWHGLDKDNTAFFFSHGNDSSDGYRDASNTYSDGPYRWNELTLGAGSGVEWVRCDGTKVERSSFDFEWQNEIVGEYYESLREETE